MSEQQLDMAKAEAFAGQMLGVLNNAAIALMTSIGHQTGLFDALSTLPPATSSEIAASAGLNERYVREWLGAMVTGGVVSYDAAAGQYDLPAEHAMWLTTAAGKNNFSLMAQFVPMLGAVEERVLHSFRHGGGAQYEEYPHFHQIMAEVSGATYADALTGTTLGLVPGITERLAAGIQVADIGCGSGRAINLMAEAFPNSQFIGYDFSGEAIAAGRAEAARLGLANARFEVKDAATLSDQNRFDFVTAFDAIHDQAQPARVLAGIADALKEDGIFLMVDIAAHSDVHGNLDHLAGPLMYTISCMHCMSVSLGQDGAGLGAMWGEQTATRMLAEAGFGQVEVKRIEEDLFNSYYVARLG
ncbi:MAG: class I SAM-dependent methyltransferase [Anaerolineales bacterium]|nr:class I SAM-dependent methyltransferase [Anaerolineales bacterium]